MDEETKKAIAEAVAEATKGLKDQNSKLIGEVRTLKQEKQDAIDAAEEAANEAATKTGDVEAIKTSLKTKHTAEITKLTEQLTKLNGDIAAYKIDSVISAELAKLGVMPAAMEFVANGLKAGATIVDGEAVVNGVPLAEHIAAFSKSPAAQLVIAAPQNSGAGATGSNANAGAHDFTKDNIRNPQKEAEWMALEKTNPTLFKQIAVDTGRNEVL